MRSLSFLSIAFLALLITGCYYDKAELVYPPTTGTSCDTTTTMKYSTDVVSILQANCYVCHSGNAGAGAGYKLDTYTGVKLMADNGRLVRAIMHTGPSNTHMPQGGAKLPECNIAKIRTWIRMGTLNN
jgi:hypothetical protein